MTTLLEFLAENPVDNLTQEVIISERLKDWPFTVKAMTGTEFEKYTRQATVRTKRGRTQTNWDDLNRMVVLNHTVEPDFRNAAAIESAGCRTPEEFLNKALLAGEIAELSKVIMAFSGFDEDFGDVVEEVKN